MEKKYLEIVLKTLDDHKAENVEVLDVRERTPFADYYVLATALNSRQLDAIANAVVDKLEEAKLTINHKEGKATSGWVLIDAHSVIINIFSERERERISLEELLK